MKERIIMFIYIITKCGRALKDEAIQYLLERISLAEGNKKYIYRCIPGKYDRQKILNELEKVQPGYRFLFYENMENWQLLTDVEKDRFIELLQDPVTSILPVNEILTWVVENK